MPARPRGLTALLLTLTGALLIAWFASFRRNEPRDGAPESAARHPTKDEAREPPSARMPEAPAGPDVPAHEEMFADTDGLVPDEGDAIAAAWSAVDLDEVRRALPDNLYFELSAPSTDDAVAEERAAERERWNVQYGKILSGTGSEEEIRAYYDFRARLSTDYVEFATYLLDHFGDQIPERDVGMLELARKLHLARLEEIPRKVEEAFARKRLQDEARAAWLADEAELGRGEPGGTQPK